MNLVPSAFRLGAIALGALSLASCTQPSPSAGSSVTRASELSPGTCNVGAPCAFTQVTPSALSPAALVLAATSSLQIDDRVVIKEANGTFAAIANVGTGATRLGTDTQVGNIWSSGPVTLGDRTVVNGTIRGTSSVSSGNNVTIKGGKNATPFTSTTVTGSMTFPAQTAGAVTLLPGVTAALRPGAYGAATVNARAVLRLAPGSYSFESLDLEPTAVLALDTTAAPITIYVRTTAILRSAITNTTDARNFTLIYFGAQTLSVETPFAGTLIASVAKIDLMSVGTAKGAFFGKSIEVHPDVAVTHVAGSRPAVVVRTGRIEAESFDVASGGHNAGTAIDQLTGGAWLLFRAVDFGTAGQFNRIRFNLSSPTGAATIAVHVDALDGTTVATHPTLRTGADYLVESTRLPPTTSGIHDVYVVVTGAEAVGLDWLELYKGPTSLIVVGNPGPLPSPDAGVPDLSGTPSSEEGDVPDNTFWMPLNQHVQIPPHSAEGVAIALGQQAHLLAQVHWRGGAGPVRIGIFDQALNQIAPLQSISFPGDNLLDVQTPALSPQTLEVSVRNDGNTMITIDLQVGFLPSP